MVHLVHFFFLPFLHGMQLLWLSVCFVERQWDLFWKKNVYFKSKGFAPFLLEWTLFQRRGKQLILTVTSPVSVSILIEGYGVQLVRKVDTVIKMAENLLDIASPQNK